MCVVSGGCTCGVWWGCVVTFRLLFGFCVVLLACGLVSVYVLLELGILCFGCCVSRGV